MNSIPVNKQKSNNSIFLLEPLAQHKKLTADFLYSLGVRKTGQGFEIPYRDIDGTTLPRARVRQTVEKSKGFWTGEKDGSIYPYGLDRLKDARHEGYLIIDEGESDCWTLWFNSFPALGLPGNTHEKKIKIEYLESIPRIYISQESGDGGKVFVDRLTKHLTKIGYQGEIRIFTCGQFKDPSDLYINDPENFPLNFQEILAIAEPWELAPTADDEDDFTPTPDPWPKMPDAAFYGLAGKFVELVKTQVEADPAALLIQFLAAFGNLVGRGPHFIAGADYHALNLFTCLVGKSARGRKTQALNAVLTALKPIDPDWFEHRVSSGLASGEGLKNKLRDDSGEIDKRLLLREAEFGSVLSVCARKDNTLSSTLRNFWDFGTFESLTKGDPFKVTGAHVTILANITQKELDKKLNEVDIANGFGNRFLWILAKISNRLPRGGRVDEILLSPIIKPLCDALEFARSIGEAEIGMTEAAWQLWEMDGGIYDHLRRNIPGVLGEITSRAEAQVRRLACIYALLDQSQIVDVPHLDAAVAVWDYVEASERIIFGDSTGNPIADTIMTHLRQSPDGLTRKEIIEGIFQRNKPSKEIAQALYLLEEAKMARKERIQTNGRPAERWLATWT